MAQMLSILASLSKIAASSKGFFANMLVMIVVAGLGAYVGLQYVDSAHAGIKKELQENAKQIEVLNVAKNKMTTALEVIGTNLANMATALTEVKTSVETTEKNTIQIYRDLLIMKNGD